MLTLNLLVFINLIIIFAFLFFRKSNTLPNKILALVLLCPGINFISNVAVLTGHFVDFAYLFFFAQLTALFFAPLVHFYTNLLMGLGTRYYHPMYFLTLLAVLMSIVFGVEFFFKSPTEQADYLSGLQQEPYPWQQNLFNGIFIVLQQIYFSIAAFNIYKYKKQLQQRFSAFDKTKIEYISRFIVLIWALNLATIILYATLPMTTVEYIGLPIVISIVYIFILYYAFHYHSVFTPESYQRLIEDHNEISVENVALCKVQYRVKEPEIEILVQQITQFMKEKKPFLNPDLTLNGFSRMMKIPCGEVSVAINKGMRKNFFDLINQYRVEETKVLLEEKHRTQTIESISYEAGFKSRASFYRAFKKHAGVTPREFLNP